MIVDCPPITLAPLSANQWNGVLSVSLRGIYNLDYALHIVALMNNGYLTKIETITIKWSSIICKHNDKWLHVSGLKATTIYYSFWKSNNINKTHEFKARFGGGIWWVMEPHCIPRQFETCGCTSLNSLKHGQTSANRTKHGPSFQL